MMSLNVTHAKTMKQVIREKNITEKSLDVARERGLTTDDLLEYDIIPSNHLFDEHGMMTKPAKSKLVTEVENI